MAQRTVDLGSFAPGVNNRLEPTQLATRMPDRSKATYLYGADNVDISADGYVKRRHGTTLRIAGDVHSLWADAQGAYAVLNNTLVELDMAYGTGYQTTALRAAMPKLPLSYSRGADGDVYWSNQQVIRRVHSGVDRPISAEPPTLVPSVGMTSGALRAGKYLLAFTISSADGESPATPAVQIDVPDNSGFTIASAQAVNVYMSGPNGDILTLQVASAVSPSVVVHSETGRRCETLNTALMPAGAIVRHYNGRMLVASGPSLFASNPYHYGIYDPSSGYFPFPADITMVEPTTNGVYIAADQTYWISDFFASELQVVLPYGAVPGTSGRAADDTSVFWQSHMGLVTGGANMNVKNLQEEALELTPAQYGASLLRYRDGMHHVVSTRFGAETSVALATSFMEAEIVRKGTTL